MRGMLRFRRRSKEAEKGCEKFYEVFLKNRLLFCENKTSFLQLFEPEYSIVLFSHSLTAYEKSNFVETLGIVFFLCELEGGGGGLTEEKCASPSIYVGDAASCS